MTGAGPAWIVEHTRRGRSEIATGLDTSVRRASDQMHPVDFDFDFDTEFRLLEARIDGRLRVARTHDRLRGAADALAGVWSALTTRRM